jgi:hypothetical protein
MGHHGDIQVSHAGSGQFGGQNNFNQNQVRPTSSKVIKKKNSGQGVAYFGNTIA